MWGELRRVLVRRPLPEDAAAWDAYGWRAAPLIGAAQAEHEALCALLEEAGAEVVVSEHDPGNPDADHPEGMQPNHRYAEKKRTSQTREKHVHGP